MCDLKYYKLFKHAPFCFLSSVVSYCFCVRCHSLESCSLVKITPPPEYTPITVTVLKRKCSLLSIEKLILLTTCHTFLLMPVLRSWWLVSSDTVNDYFLYSCRLFYNSLGPRSSFAFLVVERENPESRSIVSSITSRWLGKEPALLPEGGLFSRRNVDRTRESGGNRA